MTGRITHASQTNGTGKNQDLQRDLHENLGLGAPATQGPESKAAKDFSELEYTRGGQTV